MPPPSFRALVRRAIRVAPGARSRLRRVDREPLAASIVVLLAGASVFTIASAVFGYHSSNNDEAVYLMQAAMLLEGQLELHGGDLAGAFRPWFFVEDGGRMYPRYSPVPAAMYAVSMALVGEPRVTLAVVAAGNTALVYVLGSMAFDRRVGVVAAGIFAASPLALVTSSVFLPYAPTTLLNLAFAVFYLRSVRDGSRRSAALAGVSIGLAFFARPYTAVLFATPFVFHASWSLVRARGGSNPWYRRGPVRRNALTAVLGLSFVGLSLAYNARLTGSSLLFPYEAFAPLDGPGFGRRRLLGYAIEYTPTLALRANGYVLRYFATRWFTAGALGTAFALCGLALAVRRWVASGRRSHDLAQASPTSRHGRVAQTTLAGLFVTVPLGNVAFWGNRNVLATMTDPTDGLISQFGPMYHFDLLAPASVFAGFAAVTAWRRARTSGPRERLTTHVSPGTARTSILALLAASLLVVAATNAAVVSSPLDRNTAYAEKYETVYEPVASTQFDDALVFVPTPYGEWQHHPFQYLQNDPGFDGPVVYALDRGPGEDFAVVDAYPNRIPYRFTYRGEWTPDPDRHVVPKLEPLDVYAVESLAAETVVGVPDRVERASVRLETGASGHVEYDVEEPGEAVTVHWSLDRDAVALDAVGEESTVALHGTEEVVLTITLVQPDGSTLTYRQETTVRTSADGVEAVWPPERSVCPLVSACGSAGTYLPDDPDAHREGVRFETRIVELGG